MCIIAILQSETFWVAVTALATIILIIVAWYQLSANNKISSATFLNGFKDAFFTEQQRVFILLIEKNGLFFDENQKIFINKLPKEFLDKFPEMEYLKRKHYLTQEFDDYFLGNFEDAALLVESNIIDINDADQHFGYYLKKALANTQVQKYINWAKKEDEDIYSKTEKLYDKLKSLNRLKK